MRSPIFIGGLDRSGKTLLRLALSTHPNIAMTRRTYMWTVFYNRFGDLSNEHNFERCLSVMMARKAIRFLEPDPARIRVEFRQGEQTYGRLFSLLHEHYAEKQGKTRWGEQEGAIEQYANQIFLLYPDAKVIHMIRDPRARYGEILRSPSSDTSLGWAGSMTGGWQISARLAHQNLQSYAENYMVLYFEKLLTRPEEALREVCDFIGEDYVPAMITLDGAIRFGAGGEAEADHAQGWAGDRAQSSLSASDAVPHREKLFIERYACDELLSHGYPLNEFGLPLGDFLLYYMEWPFNFARLMASRKT